LEVEIINLKDYNNNFDSKLDDLKNELALNRLELSSSIHRIKEMQMTEQSHLACLKE